MRAYERLLEYVKVPTASDPENTGPQPTTQCQFVLAKRLVREMQELGLQNARVDEQCYVYAEIPASPGCEEAPALAFIAHMDTSPDAPGEGVVPLLHQNYNGEDIHLPKGHVIQKSIFSDIAKYTGQTLITASGDTLLGADDKAGIAEILTACEEILCGGLPHGKICVAFTPDEEVGRGADGFDVAGLGAQYGYTVDGSEVEVVEYETFNAAEARLEIAGLEVHPGNAKDIMVNALRLAREFDEMLPDDERPENTEDRQGFYHQTRLCGTPGAAEVRYIVRDHDRALFEGRKQAMRMAAEVLRQKYPAARVEIEITDSYYNMGEVLQQHYHLVEALQDAIRSVGLMPRIEPVRGGTDGSRLSFMGLPCPNIGTGGLYYHGLSECISAEAMDKTVQILLALVAAYARRKG